MNEELSTDDLSPEDRAQVGLHLERALELMQRAHLETGAAIAVMEAHLQTMIEGDASIETEATAMSGITHLDTMTQGRVHIKPVLDAAVEGRPASAVWKRRRIAAVDAERFVNFVHAARPAKAQLLPESGGWTLILPGMPVVAAGATSDEAIEDAVDAMRDYAEAWSDRLRLSANHSQKWRLVQMIQLSDDDQIKSWIQGAGST